MSNIWVIFILLVNSGKYWIINRNIIIWEWDDVYICGKNICSCRWIKQINYRRKDIYM